MKQVFDNPCHQPRFWKVARPLPLVFSRFSFLLTSLIQRHFSLPRSGRLLSIRTVTKVNLYSTILQLTILSRICIEYDNSSVGEEEHYEHRHFRAAITDWQVHWLSITVSKDSMSHWIYNYSFTCIFSCICRWLRLVRKIPHQWCVFLLMYFAYQSMGLLFSSRLFIFFTYVIPPHLVQDNHPQLWALRSYQSTTHSSALHLRQWASPFISPFLSLSVVGQKIAILLFTFAYYSDKIKMRSPFIGLALVMMMIGFSINISEASSGAKYFGTFFVVAGAYASFPGVVAW